MESAAPLLLLRRQPSPEEAVRTLDFRFLWSFTREIPVSLRIQIDIPCAYLGRYTAPFDQTGAFDMKRVRSVVVAAVLMGAAVGLAAPAAADLVDGTYDMVRTDGRPQDDLKLVVTSCGTGCKHGTFGSPGATGEYHQQGNIWRSDHGSVFEIIDNDSLLFQSGSGETVFMTRQLVKVG